MKNILNRLFNHETLSKDEAKNILVNISNGNYNHSQIASFLTVFMMRSISIDELSGFREALLELCIKIDLSAHNTIDLCGTGGDGKDTFNISTLASFVVAGAGIGIAIATVITYWNPFNFDSKNNKKVGFIGFPVLNEQSTGIGFLCRIN